MAFQVIGEAGGPLASGASTFSACWSQLGRLDVVVEVGDRLVVQVHALLELRLLDLQVGAVAGQGGGPLLRQFGLVVGVRELGVGGL